jgi:hypothetical protein
MIYGLQEARRSILIQEKSPFFLIGMQKACQINLINHLNLLHGLKNQAFVKKSCMQIEHRYFRKNRPFKENSVCLRVKTCHYGTVKYATTIQAARLMSHILAIPGRMVAEML